MSKLLVSGACGYIGSHTIVDLISKGHEVISVDNLCNSDISVLESVAEITGKKVIHYTEDLCDITAVKRIFSEHRDIEGIIHFAALKSVSDSVDQPVQYFNNNLNSLLNLLQCSKEKDVLYFVFSSSCTVYGNADVLPVTEQTPMKEAESPYGRTKQIGEYILEDCVRNSTIKAIALRYFNPGGAHISGMIGESPTNKAQNLVPVITETAIGKRDSMMVYGGDYDTPDGTCVRDYIHVMDVASAHTRALEFLAEGGQDKSFDVYNIGIGKGFSVLEAIKSFEKVSNQPLNYSIGPRRNGDVIAIYADNTKTKSKLKWQPQFGLDDIMKTAWIWEQKRSE